MECSDGVPAGVGERRTRLIVTDRARQVISLLCQDFGRQAISLRLPARQVTYQTLAQFRAGKFDVIVGHVEGCQVHADIRHLGMLSKRPRVLDVGPRVLPHQPPALALSLARGRERHDVAHDRARAPAPRSAVDMAGELAGRFAGTFALETIIACVSKAVLDLRGSVSAEALPEMALRLAEVRLTSPTAQTAETRRAWPASWTGPSTL